MKGEKQKISATLRRVSFWRSEYEVCSCRICQTWNKPRRSINRSEPWGAWGWPAPFPINHLSEFANRQVQFVNLHILNFFSFLCISSSLFNGWFFFASTVRGFLILVRSIIFSCSKDRINELQNQSTCQTKTWRNSRFFVSKTDL